MPHYVAGMPFPEASAALIEGLVGVAGLRFDSSALRQAADSSRRQVDQLIADNDEHQAMVRKLEENIDASEGNAMGVDGGPVRRRDRGGARGVPAGRRAVGGISDEEGCRAMKIDEGLGFDATGIAEAARQAEADGYDGVWAAETAHDPFLPIAIGAAATETLEFGTGIAVAFARNPMNLAVLANDLQLLSKGRFILGLGSQIKPHITKRFSMPWSHPAPRMRELIAAMRAIWATWETGEKLEFRGEFYTHTLMTPFFDPGKNPYGNPKILLAAVGELMTEVAGEVGDGLLVHGFSTERYLREVTLPALERGAAKAGKTRADLTVSYPGFVVTGANEADVERGHQGRPRADRLLRLDPGLSPGARAPRLGRPADRAQHPLQAGRVGEDG